LKVSERRAVFTVTAVKANKGQIVEQRGGIEKESRTSAGEKQGRLLSEGARPGPRDTGLLPGWISGGGGGEETLNSGLCWNVCVCFADKYYQYRLTAHARWSDNGG